MNDIEKQIHEIELFLGSELPLHDKYAYLNDDINYSGYVDFLLDVLDEDTITDSIDRARDSIVSCQECLDKLKKNFESLLELLSDSLFKISLLLFDFLIEVLVLGELFIIILLLLLF